MTSFCTRSCFHDDFCLLEQELIILVISHQNRISNGLLTRAAQNSRSCSKCRPYGSLMRRRIQLLPGKLLHAYDFGSLPDAAAVHHRRIAKAASICKTLHLTLM